MELWRPRVASFNNGNTAERPLEEALRRADANVISITDEMWTEENKPDFDHELWEHPRAKEVQALAEVVRVGHPPREQTGYHQSMAPRRGPPRGPVRGRLLDIARPRVTNARP